MSLVRGIVSSGVVACALSLSGTWSGIATSVHAQEKATPVLAGAWTLNEELSDHPTPPSQDGDHDSGNGGSRQGGGGGGGGFHGGFGRGGFGGGGFGGGGRGGQGGGNYDPEQMARMREALRDIMNPPKQLTIAQTGSMITLTGPDGRTTRLSADGKKIKDDSTKIERRTKWEADRLVSEISGIGPGKISETYWIDAERHQLHVHEQTDGTRRPFSATYVYDISQ